MKPYKPYTAKDWFKENAVWVVPVAIILSIVLYYSYTADTQGNEAGFFIPLGLDEQAEGCTTACEALDLEFHEVAGEALGQVGCKCINPDTGKLAYTTFEI